MCNANHRITEAVERLIELREISAQLNEEIEALTNEVKLFMGDEEYLIAGEHQVTYKNTSSTRIDITALRRQMPDVAARFILTTNARRFVIR